MGVRIRHLCRHRRVSWRVSKRHHGGDNKEGSCQNTRLKTIGSVWSQQHQNTICVSFYIFSDRDQSLSSLGVSTDGIWKCMSTRQDAGGRKHLNTLNHLLSPHTYTLCHNLQTNRQVVSRQVSLSRNNE